MTNVPGPERPVPARDAVKVVAGVVVAALVVLAAFQAMGRVADRGTEPVDAAEPSWPAGTALQEYQDAELGLRITIPSSWRRIAPGSAGGVTEPSPPDDMVVFSDPATGVVLSVAAWEAADMAPFGLWLGVVAGGMVPAGKGAVNNATVAGTPAALLWRPSQAGDPLDVAAFLERTGRYYRIRLHGLAPEPAGVEGASPPPDAAGVEGFRAALASVRWADGPADAPSTVPEIGGAEGPTR